MFCHYIWQQYTLGTVGLRRLNFRGFNLVHPKDHDIEGGVIKSKKRNFLMITISPLGIQAANAFGSLIPIWERDNLYFMLH